MKNNALVKIWNVIYPIFIYYVVSNIVMSLFVIALGISEETYQSSYMMLQTIAAAVSLPILYGFYRKDQMLFTIFHQRKKQELQNKKGSEKAFAAILVFFCGMLAGVVLNNLIGATGLTELSSGYQNVTAHFFAGGLFMELLGVVLLVPVVEEILYRGIVYARLSDWLGIPAATVASALIFGLLHFNLVQFLYAFFMGLLLVYFLEKTCCLYGAFLGHIGANLMTVLRVETGILDWMEQTQVVFWISTVVMAAVCGGIIYLLKGKNLEKQK